MKRLLLLLLLVAGCVKAEKVAPVDTTTLATMTTSSNSIVACDVSLLDELENLKIDLSVEKSMRLLAEAEVKALRAPALLRKADTGFIGVIYDERGTVFVDGNTRTRCNAWENGVCTVWMTEGEEQ